mmetsp:Transcript_110329/g.276220  ORF Transcript_110329/g.276220 Transcript_110329/m.276220 type:complete len:109 (+) Transcript_110329:3-329(+)
MAIYPIAKNDARGGGGFKRAQGKGRVELKCEGHFAEGKGAMVQFCIGIGDKDKHLDQPARGPVVHDFAEQSCAGLVKEEEQWEFTKAVDDSNKRVIIRVQVQALADKS